MDEIAWRVAMATVGALLVAGVLVMVATGVVPLPAAPAGWQALMNKAAYFLPIPQIVAATSIVGGSYVVAWGIGIARRSVNTVTAGTIQK